MNITLRQITYFVAVAEAGSVSAAAAARRISQSAITESIHALEAQVGATFFVRHARGVSLTYEGHQFLRHSRLILAAVEDAGRAMTSQAQAASGTLHLGVTSLVAGYYLADLLARFRRVFPNISVRVVEDERRYIEHLLINGELNLALMLVSNLEDDTALAHETLARSSFRVWLPSKHPLLEKDSVAIADLAHEKLIGLTVDEMSDTLGPWLLARNLQANVALKTSSVEAVRSLVATGAGLAILPDMVFRPWSLEGDRIEARSIDELSIAVDVGLAWRLGTSTSAPADIFLTLARDYRTHR